jgi:hypothetical protein
MLLRRCALAVSVGVMFSPAAQADPVNLITGGFYSLAFGRDLDFRFVGTDFAMEGLASGDVNPLFACRPCASGTSLDISTNMDGIADVPVHFSVMLEALLSRRHSVLERRHGFPYRTRDRAGYATSDPGRWVYPGVAERAVRRLGVPHRIRQFRADGDPVLFRRVQRPGNGNRRILQSPGLRHGLGTCQV